MFWKNNNTNAYEEELHRINKSYFQNVSKLLEKWGRRNGVEPEKWIFYYSHIIAFSELLIMSQVGSVSKVKSITEKSFVLNVSYFFDDQERYAGMDLTKDDVQFLFGQAFDICLEAVSPVIKELVWGETERGQEMLATGIMSIYFPNQEYTEIGESFSELLEVYMGLLSEIIEFVNRLKT